ncbi:MAG TPA: AI-2E family transporter [Bacteroidia bacterium]|nr:AI-2E family transporter [Bacteroidia bacterium]
MLKKLSSIEFKQMLLLASIVAVGSIIFFSLIDFFADFLGALILYVLYRPITRYLIEKRGWKRGFTSILMLITTLVVVIFLFTLLFNIFIPKLQHLFSDSSVITLSLQKLDYQLFEMTGQRLMNPENIKLLQNEAAEYIKAFLGQSISVLGDIGIMLLFLYFMLSNTGLIEKFVIDLLPMRKSDITKFTEELKAQTFSNVLGAPVLALLQGLIAALGYWIFGLNEPFFWGIITGLFSFIPMVGGALIWVPSAIFLYTTGQQYQALALLLYGTFVISMIDNVLRFAFQKKFADVHPLITVMGVILGLKLFGLPGIIFGPLLISYFLLLATIYKEQFIHQASDFADEDVIN